MSKDVSLTFNHAGSGKKFNTISDSQIDFSGKEDGKYTAEVKLTIGTGLLELPCFIVNKTKDVITPGFIDLKVIRVEIYFFYNDTPFSEASCTGTVTPKDTSKTIKFSTRTSGTGTISLYCPEGHLQIEAIKVVNGNQVKLSHEHSIGPLTVIYKKEDINQRKTIVITVNQASNLILNGIQCTGSVAILGDCSGSMSSNNNIEKLRHTYSRLWDTAKKEGLKSKIAFTVWDTQSYFCEKSWLSLAHDKSVQSWILGLQARGGNDMNNAITDAIKTFTGVENIIVICDGDVTPFTLESWRQFRLQYPKITFHFVAVGSSSDFKIMKEMAMIGNGSYTGTNI